jgi:hypothetical protein
VLRQWLCGLTFVTLIAVGIGGVCAPGWVFRDQAPGTTDLARRHMKAALRTRKIPPLVTQIVRTQTPAGGYPVTDGAVHYRAAFGVVVGQGTLRTEGSTQLIAARHYPKRELAAWATLVAVEAALVALLLWQLWTMP